ncbi:hypothetical protein HWB79_gp212 [Streptomyces phage LukeCage]|jgi:hypothetical protein|uniref:Uncharacterized protein n=2 Tax=Karimacvirus TaxID=2843400 RepID=A0A345M8K3_9CAUD|nr:hypothetical protein HWB77_gp213 [Streptomyces phage StarPlatinum]YP_009839999.1 hypothetical protein HWB79_gp212 [Streptomyces phage LukeCage]AXH66824.1 hypothetical protein SEA_STARPLATINUM_76 [Streptomyces phage StarPlatinum]AXH69601.1 hypothetical protein SEA_LUKECAGE_75 [Streptomyces phage LukeCage]
MSEKVSWGITYKHNLGNFQNVDITAGAETDLLPGETVDEGLKRVSDDVLGSFFSRLTEIVDTLEDK